MLFCHCSGIHSILILIILATIFFLYIFLCCTLDNRAWTFEFRDYKAVERVSAYLQINWSDVMGIGSFGGFCFSKKSKHCLWEKGVRVGVWLWGHMLYGCS